MKHLKFLIFSLAFTAFLFSCETETDPCDGITCMNGGECVEGDCDCPTGTSGETCATLWRDAVMGTHNAQESCTVGSDYNYDIVISAGSSLDKINITNIYAHAGVVVEATFTDANNFFLTTPIGDTGLTFTSGSGLINGNILTLSVDIDGSAFDTSCVLTVTL